MNFETLPIGSYVTLSGANVRLRRLLESYGFWPVHMDDPEAPTEIVMRRDTGPLLPILKLVG